MRTHFQSEQLEINRTTWDRWALEHAGIEHDKLERLRAGKPCLTSVECQLLAPYVGKTFVHVQCHLGLDVLSARLLGFKDCTGIDFSATALQHAGKFGEDLGLGELEFWQNDVSREFWRPKRFDVVFVNFGSLCWIPSISIWAKNIARLMNPGSVLVLFEIHPILYAANVASDEAGLSLQHDYFEDIVPYESYQSSSYLSNRTSETFGTYEWNHGLSEIFQALTQNGMGVAEFVEYEFSPWKAFADMQTTDGYLWRSKNPQPRLPMSYSLVARNLSALSQR